LRDFVHPRPEGDGLLSLGLNPIPRLVLFAVVIAVDVACWAPLLMLVAFHVYLCYLGTTTWDYFTGKMTKRREDREAQEGSPDDEHGEEDEEEDDEEGTVGCTPCESYSGVALDASPVPSPSPSLGSTSSRHPRRAAPSAEKCTLAGGSSSSAAAQGTQEERAEAASKMQWLSPRSGDEEDLDGPAMRREVALRRQTALWRQGLDGEDPLQRAVAIRVPTAIQPPLSGEDVEDLEESSGSDESSSDDGAAGHADPMAGVFRPLAAQEADSDLRKEFSSFIYGSGRFAVGLPAEQAADPAASSSVQAPRLRSLRRQRGLECC